MGRVIVRQFYLRRLAPAALLLATILPGSLLPSIAHAQTNQSPVAPKAPPAVGTIKSIDGNVLSIAKDPASSKVPGDGTFRAIDGVVSSGPSDSWLSPDGAYLYQIYGNASKLVGYATKPDGSLEEVTSVTIPYNSPEGLAGF